ncbi:heavy-metal-associated domain-containing protein [Mycetocola zhadangensis]|nr:heavy metal-associated domain-containing protein [Mycetocola zhadangensis]GGE99482.1 hypothetical protein GCM10011313_23040 [Mycetocola zhadangensis]
MATGPNHDLGLTEKRAGRTAPSDGCCGDAGGGCGGGGCGGMCGSESSTENTTGGCGSGGGCACSTPPAPTIRADSVIGAPKVSGSRARVSTVLEVTGMTRARCIVTVMNTLERVKGVDSVDVDLNSGGVSRVTVLSSGELDSAVVGSAIDEAGYALVGELAAAR